MSASTLTSNTGYLFRVEPLTGTNFSTWRDKVKLTLGVMDLDHALRINPPATLTTESTADQKRAYKQWERSNCMSLMIIKNSISVAIRGAIHDSENAKEHLSFVEEQFKGTSKSHANQLQYAKEEMKNERTDCYVCKRKNASKLKSPMSFMLLPLTLIRERDHERAKV
nr:UBN2_2 domain-containing protein [Tanacetum cinerariifolium]